MLPSIVAQRVLHAECALAKRTHKSQRERERESESERARERERERERWLGLHTKGTGSLCLWASHCSGQLCPLGMLEPSGVLMLLQRPDMSLQA